MAALWAVARGEAGGRGRAGLSGLPEELRIPRYPWEPSLPTSHAAFGPCSSCPVQKPEGSLGPWRSSSPERSGPSTALSRLMAAHEQEETDAQ